MATNIRLKSSTQTGKIPSLSDIALRELAINTTDGKLFLRKGDGSGTDKIVEVTAPLTTSEPIGHEDKSQSLISFNNTTRVFTIQPASTSFNVWCKGIKYVFTTAQTLTIPNTTGLYYIYFDSNGVLQYRTTFFDWENDTPTAYVYWNATAATAPFVADERHGIVLDWQTHEYLHRTRGAVIAEGFSLSNYTTTGTGANNSDAQFDLANGTFFDEDLQVDITHSNTPTANTWQQDLQGPARVPVFYLSGTSWVRDNPTDYAVKQGTNRAQYNLLNGTTWTAEEVSTNSWYTTSWIIATNNINYPVIAIMGQSASNKISDQESVSFSDLTLTNFPIVEFRPLWKIIWQTDSAYANTPNVRIAGVYDIRQLSSGGGGGVAVSDHGLLTGLTDDDHLQYLHTTIDRTGVTANINTSGTLTTTNSGNALFVTAGKAGIGTTQPLTTFDGYASWFSVLAPTGNDSALVFRGNNGSTTNGSAQTLRLLVGSAGTSNSGTILAHDSNDATGTQVRRNNIRMYDTGISFEQNDNTDVLTIDTSNARVGIGTTSISSPLHVFGSRGVVTETLPSGITLENGIFLLGLTTARNFGGFTPPLQIEGNVASTSRISIVQVNDTAFSGGIINLGRARGTAIGGVTAVQDGDTLGAIFFNAADGTDLVSRGAGIEARITGTVGSNNTPASLIFSTTNSGSDTPTEKVRIVPSGNVGIGTTNPASLLNVYGANNTTALKVNIGANATYDFSANSASAYTTTFNMDATGLSIGHGSASRDFRFLTNSTARLTITGAGNVGIGITNPSSELYVNDTGSTQTYSTVVNRTDANFASGVGIAALYNASYTTAGNQTSYASGINSTVTAIISSGATNLGYIRGGVDSAWRNFSTTLDNGTLSNLYGKVIQYGHYNESAATPVTTTSTGLGLFPYALTGTITTIHGINVGSVSSAVGATATNIYGIRSQIATTFGTNPYNLYIDGAAQNYIAGNVGIGTTDATSKLHTFITSTTAYTTSSGGNILTLQNSGAGGYAGLRFISEPSSAGNAAISSINSFATASGDSALTFSTRQSATLSEKVRITAAGNVGIGTINPVTKVHISDGNGDVSSALYTSDYLTISAENTAPGFNIIAAGSTNSHRGVFKATRARGTLSSPLVPILNDNTFSLIGAIYDSVTSRATAAINMDVDGEVSDGVAPQRISFWTGTTNTRVERVRISSSGNVGVGTTNPTKKLHIYSDEPEILLLERQTNNNCVIEYKSPNGSMYAGLANSAIGWGVDSDNNLGTSPHLLVARTTGNVGLGITNPTTKFEVFGDNSQIRNSDFLIYTSLEAAGPRINFGRPSTSIDEYLTIGSYSSANNIDTKARDFRIFSTATSSILYAKHSDGNVGIGTTNPTSKLHVVGNLLVSGASTFIGDGTTTVPAVFAVRDSGSLNQGVKLFATSSGNFVYSESTPTNSKGLVFDSSQSREIIFRIAGDSKAIIQQTGEVLIGSTSATGTTSQLLQVTGGAYVSGNVGIGATNPSYKLEVNGSFAATTKSFVIDHPTKPGMTLRHGSLEGPENGVYVRGRITGNNTIDLPDYWTGLVDESTITVNLTPIGRNPGVHSVIDIVDNTVVIESSSDVIDCFYMILGERKDVEKMEVEY